MPRCSSWIIYWAFFDVYMGVTYSLFSYIITLPPRADWYLATTCIYLLIAFFVYVFRRITIDDGEIRAEGIGLRKRKAIIPFGDIEKIVVEQGSTSCIHMNEGMKEVRLSVPELVALAKTELNDWTFKDRKVSITRGTQGKGFSAVYAPTGKYADAGFVARLVGAVILGIYFLVVLGSVTPESLFMVVVLFLFLMGIKDYKEVIISIGEEKIQLKDENLLVHSMTFTEIEKMEKGLLRTKISAKGGKFLLLPRALYLVPELLAGFTGVKIT